MHAGLYAGQYFSRKPQSKSIGGLVADEARTKTMYNGEDEYWFQESNNTITVNHIAYTIDRRVDRHGAAFVFKAKDDSGNEVAIKITDDKTRFDRELAAMQTLSDSLRRKNMLDYFRALIDHGTIQSRHPNHGLLTRHVLVLEWAVEVLPNTFPVNASTVELDHDPGRTSPTSRPSVDEWAKPVALALDFLHRQGWIHGDVSHGNVLRVGTRWKLADFHQTRSVRSIEPVQLATPQFMAPEVWNGHITGASDVWAYGALLQWYLTGELPFGENNQAERARRTDSPTIIAGLGEPYDSIIQGCLQRQPLERIPMPHILELWGISPSQHVKPLRYREIINQSAAGDFSSLPAHAQISVTCAAYAPDGCIFVGDNRGNIAKLSRSGTGVWTGEVLQKLPGYIKTVAVSPNGQHYLSLSSQGRGTLYSLNGNSLITGLDDYDRARFYQDGIFLFRRQRPIDRLDLPYTGHKVPLRAIGEVAPIREFACSLDGQFLLISRESPDNFKVFLRRGDGEPATPWGWFPGHTNGVICLAFVPGQTQFLTGSWDGTVRLWEQSIQESFVIHTSGAQSHGSPPSIQSLDVTADARRVAFITKDHLYIYDLTTKERLIKDSLPNTPKSYQQDQRFVICAPDSGHVLVAGGTDELLLYFIPA